MNADEMRKLKQEKQAEAAQNQFDEGYNSIMHVIQEMAQDGLDYLITDSDFEVAEAQYICKKLIDEGYKIHATQTGNLVAIEVDWS